MPNDKSSTGYTIVIALALSLAIVVAVSILGYSYMAHAEPTPQQRAAQELPTVLQTIQTTQPAADQNASAKARKEALVACVDKGECPTLGTTGAR
jgi:hypothetical protein